MMKGLIEFLERSDVTKAEKVWAVKVAIFGGCITPDEGIDLVVEYT